MATKAVAALLRNKMAGVVSLSPPPPPPSPSPPPLPFPPPPSFVSVHWSRLVVTPPPPTPSSTRALSCPLTLLLILSLQPSIHTPHMWVSSSLQLAGAATPDTIKVMLWVFSPSFDSSTQRSYWINRWKELMRKTQIGAFKNNSSWLWRCQVRSFGLTVRWDTERGRMVAWGAPHPSRYRARVREQERKEGEDRNSAKDSEPELFPGHHLRAEYFCFFLACVCVSSCWYLLSSLPYVCPRSLSPSPSLASSPPLPSASITQTQTHACSRRIARSRRMRAYTLSLSLSLSHAHSLSLPLSLSHTHTHTDTHTHTHVHIHTHTHTHTHTPFLEVLGAAAALALKEICRWLEFASPPVNEWMLRRSARELHPLDCGKRWISILEFIYLFLCSPFFSPHPLLVCCCRKDDGVLCLIG